MMNPVRAVLLGVAALATILTRLGARPTVNPATLARDIDAQGPRAVIATLARTGQWDGVVRHIDGGGDAWLAVAAKLAPGSDAGSAEDLGISLATALPRNAAGVLRIMRLDGHNPLRAARVCGLPFIGQPKAQTDTYRASAVDAVTRVSDPALADRRSRCLAALRR